MRRTQRKEGEISGIYTTANVVVDIVRRERTKALVDRHCLSVDGVRERSHMTRVIDPGQRRALSNPPTHEVTEMIISVTRS